MDPTGASDPYIECWTPDDQKIKTDVVEPKTITFNVVAVMNGNKAGSVHKTNFVTTDSPKEIDVEKYFYDQAHNHDGRAHVKILKMFKKHEGEYKHSGERWEEYQSWIVQAMVRQGNMVQV